MTRPTSEPTRATQARRAATLGSTRELGLVPTRAGKVRDLFQLGDRLLLVATDRLSAYDVVFDDLIPGKGVVLTRLSVAWFEALGDLVQHHLLATDRRDFPAPFKDLPELEGRSMLVRSTERIEAECIVRGYLAGSGWRDYRATGQVCGIALPPGLRESDPLPQPIFTPSTKAEAGHDENLALPAFTALVGERRAEELARVSLALYERAVEMARDRGILIADTKFEFGTDGDALVLIDEVLTPDSSRFWPAAEYRPGGPQPSFDKQFVRDWVDASGWDHQPPAPHLPPEIVARTAARYEEALARLFPGAALQPSEGTRG